MINAVLKNARFEGLRLNGNCYADSAGRFMEGEWVITSPIEERLGANLYKTKSGTVYYVASWGEPGWAL